MQRGLSESEDKLGDMKSASEKAGSGMKDLEGKTKSSATGIDMIKGAVNKFRAHRAGGGDRGGGSGGIGRIGSGGDCGRQGSDRPGC